MDLTPLIPVVAIIAFAAVRIANIRANRSALASTDMPERLEALERTVHAIQQDLTETQERLDFTERILSQAREEKRIGG
jgi:predicted  nucleic acid-binding Zn-ribbon protein